MTIRVGINGFGRIGRNFFRAAKLSGANGSDHLRQHFPRKSTKLAMCILCAGWINDLSTGRLIPETHDLSPNNKWE